MYDNIDKLYNRQGVVNYTCWLR